MKKKTLFLNFVTFAAFLFIFSGNTALAVRIIPFPLNKAKQLEVFFERMRLRVNTEKLKPDELRFLQDSMDGNPTLMLYNEDVGRAIIRPSSHAEQVYQKVFFARLNPHDHREMSSFLLYLFGRQDHIFEELAKKGEDLSRRSNVRAWRKVIQETVFAVQRGDFNISLSDFHASYMNFLDEVVDDVRFDLPEYAKKGYYTLEENQSISIIGANPAITEKRTKAEVIMVLFWDFVQATTKVRSPSVDDPALATLRIFYKGSAAGYSGDPGEGLRAITTGLSKIEKGYLRILDKMFGSPFYRQSEKLTPFFMMTLIRNPNIINNKGMIGRLWNSGDDRLQGVLTLRLRQAIFASVRPKLPPSTYSSMIESNTVVIPPEVREEVYMSLAETRFFQAMVEASKENEGVQALLESELKMLWGN